MKKYNFLLIILVLFFAAHAILSASDDLKNVDLKGPVKTMTKTTYIGIEKNGKYEKSDIKYFPFVSTYNMDGKIILGKEHDPAGSVIRTWVYKYDGNGNRISIEILDINGKPTGRVEYKYDDKNNLTEKVNFDENGKIIDRFKYKYDDKGNKTVEEYYDSQGNRVKKYVNKYDEKGNKIEDKSYTPDDNILAVSKYKYDGNNNLLEKATYRDNLQVWKETFKYDDKGRQIERAAYVTNNEMIWKLNLEYNEKGSISKLIQHSFDNHKNNKKSTIHVTINGPNDITETNEKPEMQEETTIHYIYEYDNYGNWTKKISISDTGEITIDEREIEYYEN